MAEVQALALTTIAKMVQLGGAVQIRPHLPELTAVMLESLSGMEVCTQHDSYELFLSLLLRLDISSHLILPYNTAA